MVGIALGLMAAPLVLFGYAYVGYPVLLRLFASRRPLPGNHPDPAEWPAITIAVPCYNEAGRIHSTLESVLATDYPPDKRQILVVSDASTDDTDRIAEEYANRGVELLRMPVRQGKTAGENAAIGVARGELVVNVDASVRILPASLKALVRPFHDHTVGVVSSRDVSTGGPVPGANQGESDYVGYEMWVRSLETRMGSIVGASGSFFAIRREIHEPGFPEELSRDFASALIAREHGYRSVSAPDAVCLVPRTASLRTEFRRKTRTMARGLETLWYKRHLMNPIRHGTFAWMLVSHKLSRWIANLSVPFGILGVILLALEWRPARALLVLVFLGVVAGALALRWPDARPVPRVLAAPGFVLASNLAGLLAWAKVLRRKRSPTWEPTRRS